MKGFVHLFEPRVIHVGVELRCSDTRVAEHFLHLAQVGTARKEMGGETMPQGMRADFI